MFRKPWLVIILSIGVLALAALACGGGTNPSPTPPPPAKQTPEPTKATKPTATPVATKTTKATPTTAPTTGEAQFTNLQFASQVISDSTGLRPVDPGTSFANINEINAVWDYEGTQDGPDFQRVWKLNGETALDKTSAWDGGDSGTYHLSMFIDNGTLDPGQYILELYYDGNLLATGDFEITAGGGAGTGDIVYEDDFSDDTSGWDIDDSENASKGYDNGKYFINVKTTDYFSWANPNSGLDLQDATIDVDAKYESGPKNNKAEFGVICRYVDSDNFYYLVARADGYAAIFKVENGDQTLISSADEEYSQTSAVKKGKVDNHLQAVCSGSTLTLYVNGESAVEAEDTTHASGDVGLIVGTFDEGNVNVTFDNFVVTQPQ